MRYKEVNLQSSYQALDICVPVDVVLVTQLREVSHQNVTQVGVSDHQYRNSRQGGLIEQRV
jgi:hypothetical protein